MAFVLTAIGSPLLEVRAQNAPLPNRILRAWHAGQAVAARDFIRIEFDENTARTIDGPFGRRRSHIRARVSGEPGSGAWRRDVISYEKDGRDHKPRERGHRGKKGHGPPDESLEEYLQALLLPPRLLARMEPTGPATTERLNGAPSQRFELAPRGRDEDLPIERVTVWFDRQGTALLRTRAVVQRPGTSSTLLVTTDYERKNGLDVPVRRHIEGTVQTKRRLRTFTLLLNIDSEYFDYRFVRS